MGLSEPAWKHRVLNTGLALLLALVLLSCASLTEEECLEGDWYQIGQRDGANGASLDRLKDHVKACSEVGVTPNQSIWKQGRKEGLKQYCTPASAYEIGRGGRSINNVCSASQFNAMQEAFAFGRQYYDLPREIQALETQIIDLRGEIKQEIEANNGEVNSEVFFLRAEIDDLNRRIGRLERERRFYAVWP